jgi:dUTP pyrophosphatase
VTGSGTTIPLRVRRIDPERDADLELPRAMSAHAAGMDVRAALAEPLVLQPGGRAAVPTGLQMAVPPGAEIQVRPRSGLAIRHGVTVINAPGTIDADYRGEVKVLLANLGQEPFTIERGMRIAQLVVARVASVTVELVDNLDATERGAGGFGSTGTADTIPRP